MRVTSCSIVLFLAASAVAGCSGSGSSSAECRAIENKLRSCDLGAVVTSPTWRCEGGDFYGAFGDCWADCLTGASCADLEGAVCGGGADALDACFEDCLELRFACADGSDIPAFWECDGDLDCPDGSDEHDGCPSRTFVCADGTEIPWWWECDGDLDCPDGSDEHAGCPDPLFRCADGTEIPAQWECDGDLDCPDGSDEHADCWYAQICEA